MSDSATQQYFLEKLGPVLGMPAQEETVSCSALRTGGAHETHFTVVAVEDFLDVPEGEDQPDWIWEDYLAAGGLALLAGKPKEGKPTFCYELAVKVSKGQPFLGRQTRTGGVLIIGLEEHPRDMRRRLRALGAEGGKLFIYGGASLRPTAETLEAIKEYVRTHDIRFILVDTLASFWTVADENDAASVQKAIQPLLTLARDSGACVLLIHHARKSEGQNGDEIRGSGALFAAVDVALILKRHEVQTQRRLTANSRYEETPQEVILDLTDSGYVALGDPASVNRQAKREKMRAVLAHEGLEAKELAGKAQVPERDAYRLLNELHQSQEATRTGTGRRNNPFRYAINSFRATPLVLEGTPQKTNSPKGEASLCRQQEVCETEPV
jgi:RecA-family ATPase